MPRLTCAVHMVSFDGEPDITTNAPVLISLKSSVHGLRRCTLPTVCLARRT